LFIDARSAAFAVLSGSRGLELDVLRLIRWPICGYPMKRIVLLLTAAGGRSLAVRSAVRGWAMMMRSKFSPREIVQRL